VNTHSGNWILKHLAKHTAAGTVQDSHLIPLLSTCTFVKTPQSMCDKGIKH